MSGDIEDFLRRAAQRRAKRSSSTPVVIDEHGQMQPQQPAPAAPQRKQPAASKQRVASKIESRKQDQRAPTVGSDIGERTHQRREQQMHRKFDHQVGSLEHEDEIVSLQNVAAEATQEQAVANEIAAMLRDPKTIRQAIILSEIMNPPSHRW